ncbi:MlaD family protein [[Mycobacterium] nativiensis]|uniref:MlaD family protein n=1 Tax=[Mycobacterium] nativiensis TaxID=2855503 RepID=A0ABU5XW33_9MYCO|nr:MlaD family protein [Mycolicibacter sp. MYC340]MEB3031988.1 MlaD family protein [Mycolicibacter sp. MYC340]
MRLNAGATLVTLAILTVVGAAYMAFGVLDLAPTRQATRLTLMLDSSGGLLPTSHVTMRGIKVGRVTGIQTAPRGLAVSIELDRDHPVPADSPIRVENLSVAGEQYIDFRPMTIKPPYFTDGAVIPADQVAPRVTVSDLLAQVNALFSAIHPADVQTVVTNAYQAVAGNDDALDSLATSAGLAAKLVQDDKQLLAALFGDLSTLTTGMGELNVGKVFSETGTLLPGAVPAFLRLIHEFDELTHVGQHVFGPGDSAGTLVAKLDEYLEIMSVPLGTFAEVLQPATAPLRDIRIDAGHWLDFWESTFNDTGGVRIQLNVPDWHQP